VSVRNERGAIAIIVSVCMVSLMGITAIAVDLSMAWSERRSMQSGADLAALAGAVELGSGGGHQGAVDKILASVNANLPGVDAADWSSANCSDADALDSTAADLGLTPPTNCISFADDFTELRVKVPPQKMDTAFGPIIGIDEVTVKASANALGALPFGSPPPFAVLDGFQAGDSACLRTSSNLSPGDKWTGNGPGNAATADPSNPDPCDSAGLDASSQYMGTLNPPLWFDDAGSVICKSNEIGFLIAAGIDHQLARFIDSPTPGAGPSFGTGGYGVPDSRAVLDACGTIPTDKPNTLELTTGVTAQVLRCSLVTAKAGGCATRVPGPTGVASADARLHQGAYVQTTYEVVGERFDNEPLWNFIDPDINSLVAASPKAAPNACAEVYNAVTSADPSWDYYDKRDRMIECLERWKDTKYEAIFTKHIGDGGRFMFAPLLAEDNLSGGAGGGPTSCPGGGAPKCVHMMTGFRCTSRLCTFRPTASAPTATPTEPTSAATMPASHSAVATATRTSTVPRHSCSRAACCPERCAFRLRAATSSTQAAT
jgi:hypothetical protein